LKIVSNSCFMKIIILLISIYTFSSIPVQNSTVYVSVSTSAKKYHFSKQCRGLQRCTHTIKSTTIEGAKKSGYTVCLLE